MDALPKTEGNGSQEAKDERAVGHVVIWLLKNWKAIVFSGAIGTAAFTGGSMFHAPDPKPQSGLSIDAIIGMDADNARRDEKINGIEKRLDRIEDKLDRLLARRDR